MRLSSTAIYNGLLSLKREAEENPARFVKICVGASLAVAGGSALLAGTEMVAVASLTAGVGIALLLDASRQSVPPLMPSKKEVSSREVVPTRSLALPQSAQTTLANSPLWKGEFLKRASPVEKGALPGAINYLNHTFTEQQKTSLKNREMCTHARSSVFDDVLILQAYLEEIIDDYDASFLFLRRAAECFFFPITDYQLIEDSHIETSAIEILQKCLRDLFSEGDLKVFCEYLLSQFQNTPWKSKFFVIKTEENKFQNKDELSVKILKISQSIKSGPFISENQELLILPPDLLQVVYQTKYGENAIKIVPVLGYREVERLSNWRQRVVAIPSCIKLPAELHGWKAGPIGPTLHDYHHCLLESSNPDRPFWASLATRWKNSTHPKKQHLLLSLLDREFTVYTRCPREEAFWLSYGKILYDVWADPTLMNLRNEEEMVNSARLFQEFRQLFIQTWKDSPYFTQYPPESLENLIKKHAELWKSNQLNQDSFLLPSLLTLGKTEENAPIELFQALIQASESYYIPQNYLSTFLKTAEAHIPIELRNLLTSDSEL